MNLINLVPLLTLLTSSSVWAHPTARLEIGTDLISGHNVQLAAGSHTDSSSVLGPTFGLGARLRFVTSFGVTMAARVRGATSGLFDGRTEGLLSGGVGFRWWRAARELEVGVESGRHAVASLVPGFLTTPRDDPSVVLPFVGAFASYDFPRPGGVGFGLSACIGRDLGSRTVHASWSGLWGSGGAADYIVGGWFFGLSMRLVLGEPSSQQIN